MVRDDSRDHRETGWFAATSLGPNRPIRAIIFDIGGVVLPFVEPDEPHDQKWERLLGLEPGTIERLIWSHENHRRVYTGELQTSEFHAWIREELGLTSDQLRQWNEDQWALNPFDPQIAEWIGSLRERVKIAFLSNGWSDDRKELSERYALEELADLYVNSSEEGVLKPDLWIYELTLQRLEVLPEETVFVDDLPENVDAAISLGMHGIVRTSTDQTMVDVEALLPGAI